MASLFLLKAGSSIYSSELLRTPPGGDMLPMPRLSFYDGTAELTTRNSFLDVPFLVQDLGHKFRFRA